MTRVWKEKLVFLRSSSSTLRVQHFVSNGYDSVARVLGNNFFFLFFFSFWSSILLCYFMGGSYLFYSTCHLIVPFRRMLLAEGDEKQSILGRWTVYFLSESTIKTFLFRLLLFIQSPLLPFDSAIDRPGNRAWLTKASSLNFCYY